MKLEPGGLTLAGLAAFAKSREKVTLDSSDRARLQAGADAVRRMVAEGKAVYGINTGFGKLANTHIADGELELNAGRERLALRVVNTGDRPIQVGSHYHFAETNAALAFDRAAARGRRLDIAARTAVRFEPGQSRDVRLVPYGGARRVFGFTGAVMGPLE